MASGSRCLALVEIPGLVVTKIAIFTLQKERAAVPGTAALGVAATSNSRPSGAQGRKIVKISTDACRLPLHRQAADRHQRRLALELFGRLGFLALLYWFRSRIHCYSFAQGERMRGLVGSILVAFFNCLDVFFCFIASSYRVSPADRLLDYLRGVLKERTASFVGGSPVNTISMATSITPTAWWIPSSSTSSNVCLSSLTLRLLRLL